MIVERSGHKDTVFLREMTLPFFCYLDFVHLSYGCRMWKTGEPTHCFSGTPDVIANDIMVALRRENMLVRVDENLTPKQFVERFGRPDNTDLPVNRMFDVAAAAALDGQFVEAARCFHSVREIFLAAIKAGVNRPHDDRLLRETDDAIAALSKSGEALQVHLRRQNYRNAVALGFNPAPYP